MMSNAGEINTRSFLTMQVSNILHPNVAILDQFQTTSDAIKLMKDRSVRSVLVTDTKKEVIGLVSKTDILYRVTCFAQVTCSSDIRRNNDYTNNIYSSKYVCC